MNRSIIFRGSICSDRYKENNLIHIVSELRKWYNGEIVISTWFGQEEYASGIDGVDKIVYTQDPGSGLIAHNRRQHVSFTEGVKASSGEVLFVTRTDCLLTKDPFYLMQSNPVKDDLFRFADSRIVVGNMMTFSPSKCISVQERWDGYFRIGDWFHMGLRNDILKMTDLLEVSEKINQTKNGNQTPNRSVEQLWIMTAINNHKHGSIDTEQYQNISHDDAWAAILNNFRVVNTRSTAGIHNLNWIQQSEFHPLYMDETEYESHFTARYGTTIKE
ncbi:MAG TPA: hypothetical protein DEF82_10095 [Crocinitomicaceae bacterium]|nr:hypothetical protein [Crocinitomicaceae bacterium]